MYQLIIYPYYIEGTNNRLSISYKTIRSLFLLAKWFGLILL